MPSLMLLELGVQLLFHPVSVEVCGVHPPVGVFNKLLNLLMFETKSLLMCRDDVLRAIGGGASVGRINRIGKETLGCDG
jgi:hypothetical protein